MGDYRGTGSSCHSTGAHNSQQLGAVTYSAVSARNEGVAVEVRLPEPGQAAGAAVDLEAWPSSQGEAGSRACPRVARKVDSASSGHSWQQKASAGLPRPPALPRGPACRKGEAATRPGMR